MANTLHQAQERVVAAHRHRLGLPEQRQVEGLRRATAGTTRSSRRTSRPARSATSTLIIGVTHYSQDYGDPIDDVGAALRVRRRGGDLIQPDLKGMYQDEIIARHRVRGRQELVGRRQGHLQGARPGRRGPLRPCRSTRTSHSYYHDRRPRPQPATCALINVRDSETGARTPSRTPADKHLLPERGR